MEKQLGKTFEILRESRGLSRKEVSEGIISPQFLGKFERGKTGISFEHMLKLLYRVGISCNDFVTLCGVSSMDKLEKLLLPLIECMLKENYDEMKTVIGNLTLTESEERREFEWYLIKSLNYLLLSNKMFFFSQEKDVEDVKQYLTKIDEWQEFDMFLFMCILEEYNFEQIDQRMRIAIEQSVAKGNIEDISYIVIAFFVVVIRHYLRNKDHDSVAYFRDKYSQIRSYSNFSIAIKSKHLENDYGKILGVV